jgi:hypothetical protein
VDHLVEGPAHVQHHRVQVATGIGHAAGLVAERLHAECLGEAAGRVDREHDGAAPAFRGADRQRGRRGGLSDAAGTAAHDDPGAGVVEHRVDVQRRCRARAHDAALLAAGSPAPCSVSASASP